MRFYSQAFRIFSLFIGLMIIIWILFGDPPNDANAQKKASSTRTSIALTEKALLGPFPTATGPTRTASALPTITSTPTQTITNTPTFTPFRYFINTSTPRTPGSRNSPVTSPVNTDLPPVQPGNTSAPPPPTAQPQPPTAQPQPTSPPAAQPTSCANPQGHPIPCH